MSDAELLRQFCLELSKKMLLKGKIETKKNDCSISLLSVYGIDNGIKPIGLARSAADATIQRDVIKWHRNLDLGLIERRIRTMIKSSNGLASSLKKMVRISDRKDLSDDEILSARQEIVQKTGKDITMRSGINGCFIFGTKEEKRSSNTRYAELSDVVFSPNASYVCLAKFNWIENRIILNNDSILFNAHYRLGLIKNKERVSDAFKKFGCKIGAKLLEDFGYDTNEFIKNYIEVIKDLAIIHERGERDNMRLTLSRMLKDKYTLKFLKKKNNEWENTMITMFLVLHPVSNELIATYKLFNKINSIKAPEAKERYVKNLLLYYLISSSEKFYANPRKRMSYLYTMIGCLLSSNPKEKFEKAFSGIKLDKLNHGTFVEMERRFYAEVNNYIRKV